MLETYNENTFSDSPLSSDFHNQYQVLRDELDKLEAERDGLLCLIHEIAETAETDDLEEVLVRVREIAENRPNPLPF